MDEKALVDAFEGLYKKHFGEKMLPVLSDVISKLCANGGKLWEYVAGLVVKGVHEHVYAAYEPEEPYYVRRGSGGGLADPDNVVITISGGELDGDNIVLDGELKNTTRAGTIETYWGETINSGELIEDQIIKGYGYRFGLPRKSKYRGSFLQPRNFYQTFEDEYDIEYAWNMVLAGIQDKLPQIEQESRETAFMELLNSIL